MSDRETLAFVVAAVLPSFFLVFLYKYVGQVFGWQIDGQVNSLDTISGFLSGNVDLIQGGGFARAVVAFAFLSGAALPPFLVGVSFMLADRDPLFRWISLIIAWLLATPGTVLAISVTEIWIFAAFVCPFSFLIGSFLAEKIFTLGSRGSR